MESTLPLFKWHGQSIQTPLPRELLMLATSSQCVVEAFCVSGRPHIIGLQCDNHAAHPEDVSSWLIHDAQWIASLPGIENLTNDIAENAQKQLPEIEAMFNRLFNNFITIIQERKKANP